jgi:hypothetical protein
MKKENYTSEETKKAQNGKVIPASVLRPKPPKKNSNNGK